jgi:hypothetical protein
MRRTKAPIPSCKAHN